VAGASFGFAEAWLFSFKTFVNADLVTFKPKATSWMNYVVACETFLGIFVMTVLVVTFSRKVIR
jgi:hypothetical protein